MTKDEALKLALEALELASNCLKKADAYIRYASPLLTSSPMLKWVNLSAVELDEITDNAISVVDAILLTEAKLEELNK